VNQYLHKGIIYVHTKVQPGPLELCMKFDILKAQFRKCKNMNYTVRIDQQYATVSHYFCEVHQVNQKYKVGPII
jgi:hypothetical protein